MGTTQRDSKARLLYEEHAKTCAPDDFWGQVKRTVDGRPVDETQIAMIVAAAQEHLMLKPDDILLDLCCGNGALSERIFDLCAGGHGVDTSSYLIQVANQFFARPGERTFEVGDVAAFVGTASGTERYTKAMCYGSFKYLSDETAASLLASLRSRFPSVAAIYIGNNADRARIDKFFYKGAHRAGAEDAYDSLTGKWRTETEFRELAARTGWHVKFSRMPATFYSAHYCFDAVLTPIGNDGP